MKRLLIPFIALALCPPAHADNATFGLAELPPLPSPATAKIQHGDSLSSFLRRHGVTLEQLKQFNPGVELNSLSAGRELAIPEGGYSDPDNPIIKHIEGRRKHEAELKQRQEIAKCKAHRKRWRHYGNFEYDWNSWKQTKGTWVTKRSRIWNSLRVDCSNTTQLLLSPVSSRKEEIGVTCKGLRVSATDVPEAYFTASGYKAIRYVWGPWRLPEAGGETEMVAALCSVKK